ARRLAAPGPRRGPPPRSPPRAVVRGPRALGAVQGEEGGVASAADLADDRVAHVLVGTLLDVAGGMGARRDRHRDVGADLARHVEESAELRVGVRELLDRRLAAQRTKRCERRRHRRERVGLVHHRRDHDASSSAHVSLPAGVYPIGDSRSTSPTENVKTVKSDPNEEAIMSANPPVAGDPDAPARLVIRAVPDTVPDRGEAIVRVRAISLNRGEVRRSTMAAAGWRPGWDLAGKVERAAADGSGPRVGARVVGLLAEGAWA